MHACDHLHTFVHFSECACNCMPISRSKVQTNKCMHISGFSDIQIHNYMRVLISGANRHRKGPHRDFEHIMSTFPQYERVRNVYVFVSI
jgi:hypothetical protein